jgi:hypothetical protein
MRLVFRGWGARGAPEKGGHMKATLKSVVFTSLVVAGTGFGSLHAARPARPPAGGGKAPAIVHTVAVVGDAGADASARHGIQALEEALRARGLTVSETQNQIASADVVIVAGLGTGQGAAATVLAAMNAPVPNGPESLVIRKSAAYEGKPALLLAGGDGVGVMYAALDTADRVATAAQTTNPFESVTDAAESPFLKTRGVVIFTMNQAYFESHLHDPRYWTNYFDMFAADRINQLVLTFGYEDGGYMAPPYPYFFDVEGFPDVKVVGLTPDQQARNRADLKTLLRIAGERGVHVKAGIWDHIYRGGGQRGAIQTTSDGTKPTAGIVWGLTAANLVPYTSAALKKFYDTFPEIAETQFRMHNESGLKDEEIEPFWHEIFGFLSTTERNRPLELRVKGLPKSVIKDAQARGLTINLDTKHWKEQMGLPNSPTHVNKGNQKDSRHSYADLLEYPQTYRMDWTLWNGGTQRLLVWGDPTYMSRLATASRLYDGDTLAVTEMEATKMLGDPHDTPPRDFLNDKYKYTDYEFQRYWDFYRSFGRMAYNPKTPADVWTRPFVQHFGAAAPHVQKALELASQVLPMVNAASVSYRMFPTTTAWVEMQHQGSLPNFAQTEEGSDIAQFENLKDEATSILQGTDTAMRRPEETSRWFAQHSAGILAEAIAAERAAGANASNELKSTLTDVRILAALARYYQWRQLGGVNYNLYKMTGDLGAFDAAIGNEQQAIQAWRDIVSAAGDFYIDHMTFGAPARHFPHHWKDELPALETEYAALQAERQAAVAKPGVKPVSIPNRDLTSARPVAALQRPASPATPGSDFAVRARVTAANGVKWIRLRYRHVNQHDDFESVDMTLDPKTGLYAATIPGGFITPQWDLMYYVELVDNKGLGRIYPDLATETPYVVVAVRRQR